MTTQCGLRSAAVLAGLLLPPASVPGRAAEYITPPIMPVPTAWQGRAAAVVRVLDKLDAHVETLTLKAGETGSYKSLDVTVRSCMDRPDGMPADAGAFLDIRDQRGALPPFSGWSFSGEPSVGVFESPVYGVQLVGCQGDLVAPAAPPLPSPTPPPDAMLQNPPDASPPTADGQPDATPDSSEPAPAASGSSVDGSPPPDARTPPADAQGGDGNAPPDPVYPTGPPPAAPAPP